MVILLSATKSRSSSISKPDNTSSPEVRVIQIAISNLIGQDATYWNELFAAVALAALVPLILFFIFQRYYTQGITTTGLKG